MAWADGAAACGLGIAQALFAWGLLGWRRAEVVKGLQAMVAAVAEELELLKKALAGCLDLVKGRLGLHGGVRSAVTLGEVSEMIDIVRLGLLAGLSFDAALGLYCEARSTGLSARMAQARLSWQTGLASRVEALLDAAHDLDVRALETFAVAVGQALALGAPLSDTLARQSSEIRAAHRASVEREIERAPVKLLIPTGTLILPALLLSILGPLLAAGGML